MDWRKFLIAFVAIIIGLILLPSLSYIAGLIVIPVLVVAAGYLLYMLVKALLKK